MKRVFSVVMVFAVLFLCSVEVRAAEVSAKSAIVIDCDSGRILFEKDAYTKRGMASTTKIMTALIALETLKRDEIVTISAHASGTEGSSLWLESGEHMSVNDLIYGLMLASGNDAATAIAEHVAGSVQAFTTLMNSKAKSFGLTDTNFTNPHGLPDDNHYTTAYDLAMISREAMKNDAFREVVKTKNKTVSWENSQWDRSLTNHNKLLKMYEHAIGIKTGYTKKDGRCLVSAAEKDGLRLIAVTLSAPDDWNDHISLYNYCFDEYIPHVVCNELSNAGTYLPKDIDADVLNLLYEQSFIIAVTPSERGYVSTKAEFSFSYPVTKGDKVGEYKIYFNDRITGSVNLLAANDANIRKHLPRIIIELMKGISLQ